MSYYVGHFICIAVFPVSLQVQITVSGMHVYMANYSLLRSFSANGDLIDNVPWYNLTLPHVIPISSNGGMQEHLINYLGWE